MGPKANMDRMQHLQNRAGRAVLRCHLRTHIGDIHSALNWKTCKARCNLHKRLLEGKCIFSKVPQYLSRTLKFTRDTHGYHTRAVLTNPLSPGGLFTRLWIGMCSPGRDTHILSRQKSPTLLKKKKVKLQPLSEFWYRTRIKTRSLPGCWA